MFKYSKLLAVLAASTLLGACVSTPESTPSQTGATATTSGAAPNAAAQASTAVATLQAYHWSVQGIQNLADADLQVWQQAQQAGVDSPRLTFTPENILTVQNLCNIVSAPYELNPSDMGIKVGNAMSTRMACSNQPLMVLEDWIGRNLSNLTNWAIQPTPAGQPPELLLQFQNGNIWALRGQPTDATRFGSQPVSFFLEVAPQTVACATPETPNATCLQVREITYNEQGIQTGAGNWQAFNGAIEGFTFEPGTRSILRLNRFKQDNAQAGQAPYAYVLDMRVLSEIVP